MSASAGGIAVVGAREAKALASASLKEPMMLVSKRLSALAATGVAYLAAGGTAFSGLGQPSPWQLGFQQSASQVMDNITSFHDFLLWVIAAIALFVLILLIVVAVRFNAKSNPTPSRTTHNTLIEIAWTVIPI